MDKRERKSLPTYPDEGPRCRPMIVRQVPDEIGHYPADYDAREELDAADGVEREAGVV